MLSTHQNTGKSMIPDVRLHSSLPYCWAHQKTTHHSTHPTRIHSRISLRMPPRRRMERL
ncbi:hypothetical protein AZE42_11923, partial [Rhizopogon vesiculosus]